MDSFDKVGSHMEFLDVSLKPVPNFLCFYFKQAAIAAFSAVGARTSPHSVRI